MTPAATAEELMRLHKSVMDALREALTCTADTDEWLAACERLGTAQAAFHAAVARLPAGGDAGPSESQVKRAAIAIAARHGANPEFACAWSEDGTPVQFFWQLYEGDALAALAAATAPVSA